MAPQLTKKKEKQEEEDQGPMQTIHRKKRKAFDVIKVLARYLFSSIGLMFLSMFFAIAGANLYISIERPEEELRYELKKNIAYDIDDAMQYLGQAFWIFIKSDNEQIRLNQTQFEERVNDDVTKMVHTWVDAAVNNKYNGQVEGWDFDWTVPKALLFTITIMTTIGYGHIFPKTFMGKVITIPYALFGMPLLIIFLGNIGNAMADGLKLFYSRMCCRWCREVRLVSERLPGQTDRKAKKVHEDIVGEEYYMPTDEVAIPIVICLLLIVGYLFLGAQIFSEWEGWDLGSAAYFCFITTTTIGFGDMVPDKSFVGYQKEGIFGKFQMMVTVAYCIFGLALIAMTMSLIQEGITMKAQRMAKKMGLGKLAVVQLDVVTVRERVSRNSSGFFVGLAVDSEDAVESIKEDATIDTVEEIVEDEIVDKEEGVLPGQVEEAANEEAETPAEEETPAEVEDEEPQDQENNEEELDEGDDEMD